MYKLFKLTGIVRLLVITGLILLILGVYSIPYLVLSWSTVLIIFALILLASFIIFLLSRSITQGVVKFFVVLSVILLLFSIFLVTYNTFTTDKENKSLAIKETTKDNFFNSKETYGFNPGKSMNELDSLSANSNKYYTFVVNKDISPGDLESIHRKDRVRS